MKLAKFTLTMIAALTLSACADRMSQDGSLEKIQANYQQYEAITQQYQINEKWWLGYNDIELNRLIDLALTNNINLAKSAVAVNKALYNANLIGANLVPTFSGAGRSSAQKGVGDPQQNPISTGRSSVSHQISFDVSYTIDLWRKLADSADAATWEHSATIEDLAATRLALINGVIDNYYRLAYFHDAIRVTEQSIRYYQQISNVMRNKYQAGVIDQLSVDQSQQAVLAAQNNLISLKANQKNIEQSLRNLLNLKPTDQLVLNYPNLLKVKLRGVDMNVPVSTIANRPDLKAAQYRLQSGFKNLSAMEKSWYPTITLGASLSGAATKINDVVHNTVGNGIISFSLPFLSWNNVKWNVKLSEANYELAKLNFEQAVTSALNEIDTYYYNYTQSKNSFANAQKKFDYDKRISGYYKNRYEQGVSELRDWLMAVNTEKASELSILNAKYTLIQTENMVYKAMAGAYKK